MSLGGSTLVLVLISVLIYHSGIDISKNLKQTFAYKIVSLLLIVYTNSFKPME